MKCVILKVFGQCSIIFTEMSSHVPSPPHMASVPESMTTSSTKEWETIRYETRQLTILINAAKDIKSVIRLKAAIIQHCRQHLRNGSETHILEMVMLVLGQANAQDLVQSCDVRLHATAGEHDLVRELDEAADVARRNGIADAVARIARNDSVILTRDSDDCTAIVLVRLEVAAHGPRKLARHAVRMVLCIGHVERIHVLSVLSERKAARRIAWHRVRHAVHRGIGAKNRHGDGVLCQMCERCCAIVKWCRNSARRELRHIPVEHCYHHHSTRMDGWRCWSPTVCHV